MILMTVLLHAAADHRTVEDVEGGEQRGGPMALVVVSHGAALAGLERQPRLGAVERLDLGLLVDQQHQGMGRWVHVEADDVFHLGGEGRIPGALEGPEPMGLQAVGSPDALDRAQRHAHCPGHCPSGPVGSLPWRLGAGQRQNSGYDCGGERRLAGRPGFVAQQPFNAFCCIAGLPAPDCWSAGTGSARNLQYREALGRGQDDPGALGMLERPVTITDDRL